MQGEIEQVEKQILSLNQKKEELLVDLKTAVLNLQEHLKQEQEEVGGELLPAGVSEEGGMAERDAPDWQVRVAFVSQPGVIRSVAHWKGVLSSEIFHLSFFFFLTCECKLSG